MQRGDVDGMRLPRQRQQSVHLHHGRVLVHRLSIGSQRWTGVVSTACNGLCRVIVGPACLRGRGRFSPSGACSVAAFEAHDGALSSEAFY